MRSKIAVLSTHPIQYHSPWFRAMADSPDLDLDVLFCHDATPREQAQAGFGVEFSWDTPLLGGYPHRFLKNVAVHPTISNFRGVDTPEIASLIRAGGYEAVIVNGWHYKSAWQTIHACWANKTPVMARGDSHLHSPRHPAKKIVKSLLYRSFIPRFDACLAAGEWSSEYFLHYGAAARNVFLVPHAIDQTRFAAQYAELQPQRGSLRRRWSLGEEDVIFLFAGKFIEKKRPLEFVRAINLARQSGKQIKGLMIGDGPLRSEAERLAYESADSIRFGGFLNQSQMPAAYVASDVLVLPSDGDETWGLVVNEAMASGRACIVSDRVGCGPDLVTPGQTGFVFPLGDVEALASIMLKCESDPAALRQMGESAKKLVSRYSISAAVDGVTAAVRSVKSRRGRALD